MLESFNPATGRSLGGVVSTPAEDVARVVDEVAEVQPIWAQLRLAARARYLRRASQAIVDDLDAIRRLIVLEQGRPGTEALSLDISPGLEALRWAAERGPDLLADERLAFRSPLVRTARAPALAHQPLGVIGVIGAWSDPWGLPLGQIGMALLGGNGVVFKPAAEACLTGEQLRAVFERAGLPEGLVRTVQGDDAVGEALVESGVDRILFTGSAQTAGRVSDVCARHAKGCRLRVRSRGAMIVLADAHLPHAVDGALWGAFAGGGQAGWGTGRALVAEEVAERFVAEAAAGAQRLKVGDPTHDNTQVGPLISEEVCRRVHEQVETAVAAGATLHAGGLTGLAGPFFAPAVVTGAGDEIATADVPGPVLWVEVVRCEEEAVARANRAPTRANASVWTRDRHRGERIARALRAATVARNDHVHGPGPHGAPSRFALYESVQVKLLGGEPSPARVLWRPPYDGAVESAVRAGVVLRHSLRDADRRRALVGGALPALRVLRRALRPRR